MNVVLESFAGIPPAVAVLRGGGLVAFPTETVYGLGADARNPAAVARIFAAKGRPADHPLIVHLGHASQLTGWARDIPAAAWRLAEAFWPGPLTLVLPRAPGVLDAVTGGLDSVALRVPNHALAQALLQSFGGGLAAPSANRYGRVSPTLAAHVREELGDAVDLVLDGGPCPVGIESTIVEVTSSGVRLLRPGAVTRQQLEDVLGAALTLPVGQVRAPGRKPSHYAPRARVVPALPEDALREALTWRAQGQRVGMLAPRRPLELPADVAWLDSGDTAPDQARALYRRLREGDDLDLQVLVVAMPPASGIGVALRDRLQRAAGLGDGEPDSTQPAPGGAK